MPKKVLREVEHILCCSRCETPLAEVLLCIRTPEGELKIIGKSENESVCPKCKKLFDVPY